MDTSKSYLSKVVKEMPDSGIKDFFDIANTMEGALSLGVGEPDFPTPEHVREAAIASIKRGETKYTDNRGTVELRAAAAEYLTLLCFLYSVCGIVWRHSGFHPVKGRE